MFARAHFCTWCVDSSLAVLYKHNYVIIYLPMDSLEVITRLYVYS